MKQTLLVLAAALALAADAPAAGGGRQSKRSFRMGFHGMPYDITPEAVERTQQFMREHSDLWVFHFADKGVPWLEALADRPFPGGLEEDWKNQRAQVPEGHKVYLAVTPLAESKDDLARAFTAQGKDQEIPDSLRGKAFDNGDIVKAYTNFCRRAVKTLKPDYVCIGIDVTELMSKKPKAWEPFTRLCRAVRAELKKESPQLPIGVSHSLPLLWNQQIARAVKPTLKDMDFLGLAFYPHLGPAAEKSGGRALPAGRDQWAGPLKWVRKWSEIPVAIAETAYASREVSVPMFDLRLKGDPQTQKNYLTDLFELAEADKYAFVVWSMPFDLDRLADKLPAEIRDYLRLFKDNGLLDGNVNPKPAFEVWDKALRK